MSGEFDLEALRARVVNHVAESIRTVIRKFTDFEHDLGVDLNGESKRFLGHLIAEVLKRKAGFDEGEEADFFFQGVPLEIKHTIHNNWMIAQENVGRGGILIKTDLENSTFSIGYLILTPDNLTKGMNRDTKVSVSAAGKKRIQWWLLDEAF